MTIKGSWRHFHPWRWRAGALVAGTTPAIDISAFAADRFT
jgi:hypothetical protein